MLFPKFLSREHHVFTKLISRESKSDRPGGLTFLSGLPGLIKQSAWPTCDRPGFKNVACACHRQAGPGRQAGRLGGLLGVLQGEILIMKKHVNHKSMNRITTLFND
jgi:hypothetical protein